MIHVRTDDTLYICIYITLGICVTMTALRLVKLKPQHNRTYQTLRDCEILSFVIIVGFVVDLTFERE